MDSNLSTNDISHIMSYIKRKLSQQGGEYIITSNDLMDLSDNQLIAMNKFKSKMGNNYIYELNKMMHDYVEFKGGTLIPKRSASPPRPSTPTPYRSTSSPTTSDTETKQEIAQAIINKTIQETPIIQQQIEEKPIQEPTIIKPLIEEKAIVTSPIKTNKPILYSSVHPLIMNLINKQQYGKKPIMSHLAIAKIAQHPAIKHYSPTFLDKVFTHYTPQAGPIPARQQITHSDVESSKEVAELIKEIVKEPTKEPVKKEITELIKEIVGEPTKEPVKEEVKELLKELVKEPTKEPVKEEVKELLKELVKEPIKVPNKDNIKELVREQVNEIIKEPIREPIVLSEEEHCDKKSFQKQINDLINKKSPSKLTTIQQRHLKELQNLNNTVLEKLEDLSITPPFYDQNQQGGMSEQDTAELFNKVSTLFSKQNDSIFLHYNDLSENELPQSLSGGGKMLITNTLYD